MARVKIVDYLQFDERQRLAIQLLALPGKGRLSYEQIAEQVGVSIRQFYRWRHMEAFKDAVVQTAMANLKDELPEVFAANLKQAKGGNAKHIELLYKLMGMMIDKQEVQVEEKLQDNASVRNDIEAMRERLKDQGIK